MAPITETRPTPAQIVSRISDLATLPDVYFRIRNILDDPACTHEDIAAALSTDAAITARLLRMANSAFYGRPSSITTVSRAVSLLGTQQVHDLVLSTAVISSFKDVSSDLLDPYDFWCNCLLAGSAAKSLAEHCDILDCERLFAAGLLAQLGQLILVHELPLEMSSILHEARGRQHVMAGLQRAIIGFDYADISAGLFTLWQLPTSLVDPIRLHTRPSEAGSNLLEAAILHVAVLLAGAVTEDPDLEHLVPFLNQDAWNTVGMSAEQLQTVGANALRLTEEIAPLLLDFAA